MSEKTLQVLPSIFSESSYLLEGRPFRLKNRNYLKQIYDGDITKGMIMSGRQVEKSTTTSTSMANHTLLIPNFKSLYFAPLTDQVSVFSRERIGKLYDYSQQDVVNKFYRNSSCANAVHCKEFSNGSVNYFKHCYEYGDNIRGISVNGIWGDEIQDIHIDAIPVVEEAQSHALESGAGVKITWYTGTPKTFSNTIQQYWDRSTQNEWIIKCPHCNKYQIMGIKNLRPDKYVCQKCEMPLPQESIINGMWMELQPGKELKGFRISQLMVSWIPASEIWYKFQTYSRDKFNNEVLGRSFENADKPFTNLALGRISSNEYKFYPRAERECANKKIFMGVDWGKGEKAFTVVTIGFYNTDDKFQIIYIKKYETAQEREPDWQLNDIINLISLYRISYCVVDWGFGFTQYKAMQKIFGKRVAACYYSFNLKQKTKWDAKDQRWIVNRTEVIQDYVTAINNVQIVWPGNSKSEYTFYFDHHLCEMAEYRKSQNGKSEDMMFTHPEALPDDGLHSGVYCYLASKLYSKGGGDGITFASAYGNNI